MSGELRPPLVLSNIPLVYASANSTNVVRTNVTPSGVARDQFVSIANSQVIFANGEIVTAGSASGTLRFQSQNILTIEAATDNFVVSTTITGGTSGKSDAIIAQSAPPPGTLVTLPYTHQVLVAQSMATGTRLAAGLNYVWSGTVALSPSSDTWFNTLAQPDVHNNFNQNDDNWVNMPYAWGTEWHAWQLHWTGVQFSNHIALETGEHGADFHPPSLSPNSSDQTTEEVSMKHTRRHIRSVVRPNAYLQTNGRTIDANINPVMRSRLIRVAAHGLKPSTKLTAFFDGTDVHTYITPTTVLFAATASEGTLPITDANGSVYMIFRIPSDSVLHFKTGRKIFRLTDSPTNSSVPGTVTTSAETLFSASGLTSISEKNIISTQHPTIAAEDVIPSQTLRSVRLLSGGGAERNLGASDPLGQGFSVSGFQTGTTSGSGIFITKLDLFFATKDATLPVTVELREIDPVTGFMTQKIVPFSQRVLQPATINTSSDGTAPTTVIFHEPVFLLDGRDYAIAVKPAGGSPSVSLYTALIGANDLITTNRYTPQPSVGTLFAPANGLTYAEVLNEDLKFTLYYANFSTGVTGLVSLKNASMDYWTVADASSSFAQMGEILHGETHLAISATYTANANMTLVGQTSGANGTITISSGTTFRVKAITVPAKFQNGEVVHFFQANGLIINSGGTPVSRTITGTVTPVASLWTYDTLSTANTVIVAANVSYTNTATATTGTTFVSGMIVSSQTNLTTARIQTLGNLRGDLLQFTTDYLHPVNTTVSAAGRFATSVTTRDTTAIPVNFNESTLLTLPRYTLSRSAESNTTLTTSTMASARSNEIVLSLSTTSPYASPAIDLERTSLISVANQINANSRSEENTSELQSQSHLICRLL